MYLNQWSAHDNSRRTFYIAAFTLLLLAGAMLAGCGGRQNGNGNNRNGDGNGNGNGNGNISTRQLGASDTPIIVTGGSDYLDFGKEFKKCPDATVPCPTTLPSPPAVIYAANGTLAEVAIYDDRDQPGGGPPHDPITSPTPLNAGDTVKIFDKMNGGGSSTDPAVIIQNNGPTSSAPTGSVTIQFSEEYNATNDPANANVFHLRNSKSRRRFIRKFTVDSVQLIRGGTTTTLSTIRPKSTIEFYTGP